MRLLLLSPNERKGELMLISGGEMNIEGVWYEKEQALSLPHPTVVARLAF